KADYLANGLVLGTAINYKIKDSRSELGAAPPKGIRVYFGLVGGEALDTAIG
ncbi:hypothetical protein BGX27_000603, partial [Mortierella sp. AM989]